MKIQDHKLFEDNGQAVAFLPSPNIGGALQPEYLVIHYTAGSTADGAVTWLTNPNSNVSAHLVIGRDGSVTQLVTFDRVAYHAGYSYWEGRDGLNQYSIGIELDNAGRLMKHANGWLAPFGKQYPTEDAIEAVHKQDSKPYGWHIFSQEQLDKAVEVSMLLIEQYRLLDVVGHDDISPRRKWDPGPAFPMDSFRSRLMGRRENAPPTYVTTSNVHIRSGPGSEYKTLWGSPLPQDTPLLKLQVHGSWLLVDVLKEINGQMDLQGWVHSRYVARLVEPEPTEEPVIPAQPGRDDPRPD